MSPRIGLLAAVFVVAPAATLAELLLLVSLAVAGTYWFRPRADGESRAAPAGLAAFGIYLLALSGIVVPSQQTVATSLYWGPGRSSRFGFAWVWQAETVLWWVVALEQTAVLALVGSLFAISLRDRRRRSAA